MGLTAQLRSEYSVAGIEKVKAIRETPFCNQKGCIAYLWLGTYLKRSKGVKISSPTNQRYCGTDLPQ